MTVPEAAARLEVSPKTVYALCRLNMLAHHRIGTGRGTIRIEPADLDAYLERARVEAAAGQGTPAARPVTRRRSSRWVPRHL